MAKSQVIQKKVFFLVLHITGFNKYCLLLDPLNTQYLFNTLFQACWKLLCPGEHQPKETNILFHNKLFVRCTCLQGTTIGYNYNKQIAIYYIWVLVKYR